MTIALDVTRVERLPNSRNGNPRWEVVARGASSTPRTFKTKPDSMDAFKLREFAGPGTLKVDVELDGLNRITAWTEHGRLCHCPECY